MKGLQRKRWIWLAAVVVVLPLGTSVVWSAGGMGGLQVDPAYEGMAGFLLPGEVAGAPIEGTAAMSVDGPRATPGFASVLVHMDPAARGRTFEEYLQEDVDGNPKGILLLDIG